MKKRFRVTLILMAIGLTMSAMKSHADETPNERRQRLGLSADQPVEDSAPGIDLGPAKSSESFSRLPEKGSFFHNWGLADCTEKFVRSFKDRINARAASLQALSKRVRAEKMLFIKDVSDLSSFSDGKTSLDFVKDEQARHRLEQLTPLGFATRLESLKPILTDEEWNKAVSIWANYLDDTSKAWKTSRPEEVCGFRDEIHAMGMDTAMIVAFPFLLLTGGEAGQPDLSILLLPVSPAPGAVALTADVVTAVPSVLKKHTTHLRYDVHIHNAARTFRKFAKLTLSYEHKYHKLSGHP